MNEEINTKLIRQAYQDIRTGNIPGFLSLLAEDVVWTIPEMTNVPFSGTWQGREQVRHFFSQTVEAQNVIQFEPEEFIAQCDKVVVLGHFIMHVRATGKTSRSRWAHVWKIEGGKIRSMREFVDTLAVSRAHSAAIEDSVRSHE